MYRQERKWDHGQCSYCGNENTQFVCWQCVEESFRELGEEIQVLREEIKRLKKSMEG